MGSRSRVARSRLAGVPTTLARPATPLPGQLALGLAVGAPEQVEARAEILPDVVVISGWLTPVEQRDLVAQFREWAVPPAGLRHPRMPQGDVMSVQSVCLGWHWSPYSYSTTADDTDHAQIGRAHV